MSVALSALYVVFFAFASRLYKSKPTNSSAFHDKGKQEIDFLILIPAYAEDAVICQTVQNMLQLQYPRNQFHVTVISDHQQLSTNQWLSEHVDTLLIPRFQNSSKAKALQYAIQRNTYKAQYVLVLDADNIVEPTFLGQLCDICTNMSEKSVVQCHRQAKNHKTPVALLDAISEEITMPCSVLGIILWDFQLHSSDLACAFHINGFLKLFICLKQQAKTRNWNCCCLNRIIISYLRSILPYMMKKCRTAKSFINNAVAG